jgi:hypothetical protein
VKIRRDDRIALSVFFAVGGLGWLAGQFETTRTFFAWPYGGTWSNTIAAIEWVGIVLFFSWYLRDSVFPRLAAFAHRHYKPHADQSHEETRRHTSSELVSLEDRITSRLDGIERQIRRLAGGDPDPE